LFWEPPPVPKDPPPRSDFAELMASHGVKPLHAPAPPRPARRPPDPAPKPPPPAAPTVASLQAELVAAAAARDAATRAAAEAEARAQAADKARAAAEIEAASAKAAASKAEAARGEAEAHRKALQRALDTPRAAPPAPCLADRLLEHGLHRTELATALAQLAIDRPAAAEALITAPDEPAQRLVLEEHLVLRCESCASVSGPLLFYVEPARCDLCGGSDIKRAAERLAEVARAAGVQRIVVVGGSPAYSRQLGTLFPSTFLRFVEGWKKHSAEKARVDLRWAQVVFRWGGTMLNHSVSDLYADDAGPARVHTIAHRGISVFLDKAATLLGR